MTKRPLLIQLIVLAIAVILFIVVVIFHLFVPRVVVRPPDFEETFELDEPPSPDQHATPGASGAPSTRAGKTPPVEPGRETAFNSPGDSGTPPGRTKASASKSRSQKPTAKTPPGKAQPATKTTPKPTPPSAGRTVSAQRVPRPQRDPAPLPEGQDAPEPPPAETAYE